MTADIEQIKKKIIYRSNYRGTKEMDKLLGAFTNKYLDQLDYNDLSELIRLLEIDDNNLYNFYNGLETNIKFENNKINNLFKNFDTMSFVELVFNFNNLLEAGYIKNFLNQSLHSLLILPFFLLLMTGLASILALNNLNKKNNLKMLFIGLILVIIIYYFKDFSLALGQIEKVPLILSIWSPIIVLSLFTLIGVIQINQK